MKMGCNESRSPRSKRPRDYPSYGGSFVYNHLHVVEGGINACIIILIFVSIGLISSLIHFNAKDNTEKYLPWISCCFINSYLPR